MPLGKVNELLPQLEPGRTILLVTDFEPAPILDAMHKQERPRLPQDKPPNDTQHLTFIA